MPRLLLFCKGYAIINMNPLRFAECVLRDRWQPAAGSMDRRILPDPTGGDNNEKSISRVSALILTAALLCGSVPLSVDADGIREVKVSTT